MVFRAAHEATVDSFNNAPRNASCISWQTQNEIINLFAKQIQSQIVKDVANVKFFSLLADETSDNSHVEQLSLSLRFVKNNKFHEEFLCFVPLTSTTGEALADCILTNLSRLGLDLNFLRGQGYDGASNMSGAYRGVQARVRVLYPLAIYTHCCSHVLNLAVSGASQLPSIRNAMGTVASVCVFISRSAQRAAILRNFVQMGTATSSRKSKLIPLCETRWVERHDSVVTFVELLPAIYKTLDELQTSTSRTVQVDVAAKASQLISSICNTSFLVSVHVIEHISAILLPLSKMLQEKNLDIFKANELLDGVLSLLQDERLNSENSFNHIFKRSTFICNELEVPVALPRRANRQIYRHNFAAANPEEFFRCSVFVPYMDQIISDLENRFQDQRATCTLLWCLLPKFCHSATDDQINRLLTQYQEDIDSHVVVSAEIKRWTKKWEGVKEEQRPSNAIEALSECQQEIFPNVKNLLQIIATLPVSTATAERSFSTLRRLKTYLRTTMESDRLTGLALMSVHTNRPVNKEKILEDFVASERRRSDFGV